MVIVELLEGAVLGITCFSFGKRALSVRKKKTFDDGTLKWLWGQFKTNYNENVFGFQCPKCKCVKINTDVPNICSCPEYHNQHFHFICKGCKYANIMRTADDK